MAVVDLFLVYQFVRRLATPFKDWDAFKVGVIDDKGNIILPKKDRSSEQRKNFGLFDLMILKLKRLLGKVPGGKTRVATIAAALWLIKEQTDTCLKNEAHIDILLEQFESELLVLNEDINHYI